MNTAKKEDLHESAVEAVHFHATVTNAGLVAKLPAAASKQIAIECLVYWIGPRISPLHVARLTSESVATGTGMGTVCIIECDCKEKVLTKADLEKAIEGSL